MVEGIIHGVPLSVVDGNLQRHGERGNGNHNCHEEDDNDCFGVHRVAKKLRFPPTTRGEHRTNPLTKIGNATNDESAKRSFSPPPLRWWFSRQHHQQEQQQQQERSLQPVTPDGAPASTPGMVLSEHLGNTADVVESLTHDVKNWSLTRLPAPSLANDGVAGAPIGRKEKQQRCREARHRVRAAQRRYLEEQRRLSKRPGPG
ncbi:unnamed protein product [Pseudo-nitzschia multistriata]|uniref:Uncharacterized protein n=1 Tax=Pseudo-nitzschia multistriata TaxID=183589 RepID=A0A448YV02_9STRA|nr:unnamed protein product [Pseudo-nitzschia multistriata]